MKFIKTKGNWGKGEEIKKWTDVDKIKLSPDYTEIHRTKDLISNLLREAYDMIQVIRHEFWKANPNRSNITVDSDVLIWTTQPEIVVTLDNKTQ